MRRRRGYSLIELLVAISATSICIGAIAIVIISVVKMHQTSSQALQDLRTLDRFSDRLRADVHAAGRAEVDDDDSRLRLTIGDQVVLFHFQQEANRVERQVIDGDQVVHRDHWIFSETRRLQWEIDRGAPANRVLAKMTRTIAASDSTKPETIGIEEKIEIVVGLDRRFQRDGGTES